MKILSLHCDYIKFKPIKSALKGATLEKAEEKQVEVKDPLVIFTAIEKQDESNKEILQEYLKNILDLQEKTKAKNIVLYPYAHLSNSLSSPDFAKNLMLECEKELKKKKIEVHRAPFGFYKEFELKCKGHPLAELSRNIGASDSMPQGKVEVTKSMGIQKEEPLDARMETATHVFYETMRTINREDFISISTIENNKSTLHWKGIKEINSELINKAIKLANENINKNLPVTIELLERKKALEKCGKFYDLAVPKNQQTLRIVTIGNLPPEPCAKSHVSETKKIDGEIILESFEKVNDGYKVHILLTKSMGISKDEVYDPKKLLHEISKSKLNREKLVDNDHRILGQQMDLFSFSEVAPGMVFWHDKGWKIYNELVAYWREEHRKAGYDEISTPQILDKKLWQISGHWEKYKENIFLTNYEGREFAVKPMNCPGGMLVYKSRPRSYKELPWRVAELGIVHRQELSGVLAGLFRVIKFTQDDAHLYCTEETLEQEITGVINLVAGVYKKFGFSYHIELSTRPEKRIGDEKLWDKAEAVLESVLKKQKIKFKLNPGDGAFYGPKIDFHLTDSLGRTWQCGTIQLDFAMPERFELEYVDKDGKMKRPIMLHRTVLGSLERFIGVLLEHLNGRLPTWLAPVQVKVLSFTDKNIKAAEKLHEEFKEAGIRCELDINSAPVQGKVRDAEMQKTNYIIMIGDKEESAKTLAVRKDGKVKFGVKKEAFLNEILEEIKERK